MGQLLVKENVSKTVGVQWKAVDSIACGFRNIFYTASGDLSVFMWHECCGARTTVFCPSTGRWSDIRRLSVWMRRSFLSECPTVWFPCARWSCATHRRSSASSISLRTSYLYSDTEQTDRTVSAIQVWFGRETLTTYYKRCARECCTTRARICMLSFFFFSYFWIFVDRLASR